MKLKTLSIAMMTLAVPGLAVADELLEMQKDENNWVMPAGNYAILCGPSDWNVAWTCASGLVDYSIQLD